jgi:hypothetical protein
MTAHQCPHCALLFTYRTELELHMREDHERRERIPRPRPSSNQEPRRHISPSTPAH